MHMGLIYDYELYQNELTLLARHFLNHSFFFVSHNVLPPLSYKFWGQQLKNLDIAYIFLFSSFYLFAVMTSHTLQDSSNSSLLFAPGILGNGNSRELRQNSSSHFPVMYWFHWIWLFLYYLLVLFVWVFSLRNHNFSILLSYFAIQNNNCVKLQTPVHIIEKAPRSIFQNMLKVKISCLTNSSYFLCMPTNFPGTKAPGRW